MRNATDPTGRAATALWLVAPACLPPAHVTPSSDLTLRKPPSPSTDLLYDHSSDGAVENVLGL